MAQGSGGINAPSFSQVESSLRNVALQFASIVSLQTQLQQSLQVWRELERELTLARAAAGGSTSEFRAMEEASRKMALASTFSAGQVANSFYSLASAGLSVKQTLEAATGVMLLAQATLTDLGEASDVVVSSLSQFSLSSLESYRVSNLFVAATNNSLATMNKLAFAMRQVGPIAGQAGLSIEQTTAALDKLFDAGLRGEQAGTALRNALARLINPVGEGKEILDQRGVQLIDKATGALRNQLDVLKEMANSRQQYSNEEVVGIFGIEAASGVTALMNSMRSATDGATSSFDQHLKSISNTDDAYKQAVLSMNTLDGAMTRAGNNFNELRLQLGERLAPVVVYFGSLLGDMVKALSGASAETEYLTLANIAAYASWAVLFTGLLKVTSGLETLVKSTKLVSDGWAGLQLAMSRGAGTMADRVGSAVSGVGALARGLAGFGALALGVGAVALAFIAMRKAANEAEEAARKAKEAAITEDVRKEIAGDKGLTGTARERYIYEPVDVAGALQSVDDLENLGSGMDKLRMISVRIDTLNDQIKLNRERVQDFQKNQKEYVDAWNQAGILLQANRANLGREIEVGVQAGPEGILGLAIRRTQNDKQQFDALQEALKANVALASSTEKNAQTLALQRLQAMRELIRGLGLSKSEENKLIAGFEAQYVAAASGGDSALNRFNLILAEAAKEEQQALSANPDGRVGMWGAGWSDYGNNWVTMDQFIAKQSEQRLLFSERAVANYIASRNAEIQQLEGLITRVKGGEEGALAAARQQFVGALTSAQGLNEADAAKFTELASQPQAVAIIDRIVADSKANNATLQQKMEAAFKQLSDAKLGFQISNTKKASELAAITLFNEHEMTLLVDKQNIRLAKSLAALAKLSGDPKALQYELDALKLEGSTERTEAFDTFIKEITGDKSLELGKALGQALASNEGGVFTQFQAEFNRYAQGKDVDGAALDAVIAAMGSYGKNYANNPGLRNRLKALRSQVLAIGNENKAAVIGAKEDAEKERNKDLRNDPMEKYVLDLLGLPSAEEGRIEAQRLALAARYALANYFNFPLEKVEQEVESALLDLRSKRQDITKRFRDIFVNTLARGTEGVSTDQGLVDAFSGDLVAQIFGQGSANVFGTQITKEALNTANGMQQFVDIVITKFSAAVAGSDTASQQIDAARRMIIQMLNEFSATNAEVSAKLQTLQIEREKVQAQINNAVDTLNATNFARVFEELAKQSTFGGDMSVSIELALQAEVVKVQLNAKQAIDKVTKEFQDVFSALGIPVGVNADGTLRALESGSAAAAAKISEALKIGNQNRPAGTPQQPVTVQVAGGGTQSFSGMENRGDILPGQHALTSGFGMRHGRMHRGLDIGTAVGTQVNAAYSGKVTKAGWDDGGGGNYIKLDHGNGLETLYMHLSRIGVKVGDAIQQGMQIGLSGNTGRSTGPHLHYEERVNGKSVDPRRYNRRRVNASGNVPGAGGNIPFNPQDPGSVDPAEELNVMLSDAQKRQAEVLMAQYNQQVENIRKTSRMSIDFITDEKNAGIFAYTAISEFRLAMYDEYMGKVEQGYVKIRQLEANIADQRAKVAVSSLSNPNTDFMSGMQELASSSAEAARARNNASMQEQIASVKRLAEEQRTLIDTQMSGNVSLEERLALSVQKTRVDEDEERAIRNITDATNAANEAVGRDIALRRELLTAASEAAQRRAEQMEGDDPNQIIEGMRAAVFDFGKELPTVFETTKQVVGTAVGGIANAMTSLFTQGSRGIKSMVADMLMGMAQLIAKMLAMYAVIQLINLIPGGSLILQAVGMGSSLGASAAQSAGSAVTVTNGSTKWFADGGSDHRSGGVRSARNPAMAIYGEGDYPEAYIPMLDHKTVMVEFDNQGNPYIPVPSGEKIPVSMKGMRRFARGGTDNVIASSRNIGRTRQAMAVTLDATGPHRGTQPSATQSIVMGSHTINLGGITINGKADEESATATSQQIIGQVMQYLEQRDAEKARQSMRNKGTLFDDYGVVR